MGRTRRVLPARPATPWAACRPRLRVFSLYYTIKRAERKSKRNKRSDQSQSKCFSWLVIVCNQLDPPAFPSELVKEFRFCVLQSLHKRIDVVL